MLPNSNVDRFNPIDQDASNWPVTSSPSLRMICARTITNAQFDAKPVISMEPDVSKKRRAAERLHQRPDPQNQPFSSPRWHTSASVAATTADNAEATNRTENHFS